MFMNGRKFRFLELVVALLIGIVTISFAIQLGLSRPLAIPVLMGFIPTSEIFMNQDMLYVAIGIIGATVMPHNLFLHSSIVLTRKIERDETSLQEAIRYATMDSNFSLSLACFVNAAILMVAAATFHTSGHDSVATLEDAYQLLTPLLHSKAAPILFGIALLASGQNSTLTGTLSGQIVTCSISNFFWR
jgi:manganese transport protein